MWIIAIVLAGIWLLGMIFKFAIKGAFHILLLLAVIIVLVKLFF